LFSVKERFLTGVGADMVADCMGMGSDRMKGNREREWTLRRIPCLIFLLAQGP
jgi:hypothetical protein